MTSTTEEHMNRNPMNIVSLSLQRKVCCNGINGYFIIGIETSDLGGFIPAPWLQTAQPSPRAYRPLAWVGMSAILGLGQPSPEPWSLFLNLGLYSLTIYVSHLRSLTQKGGWSLRVNICPWQTFYKTSWFQPKLSIRHNYYLQMLSSGHDLHNRYQLISKCESIQGINVWATFKDLKGYQ